MASPTGLVPVSACVVDIVQRRKSAVSKQHAFAVDVSGSDSSKTQIWRSYQEFFEFQCRLLSSFPDEAGQTEQSERIIPYLPGKKMFSRSTRQLAETRRPEIEAYIKNLLKLPAKVSQSEVVTSFFTHRATDPVAVSGKEANGNDDLHSAATTAAKASESESKTTEDSPPAVEENKDVKEEEEEEEEEPQTSLIDSEDSPRAAEENKEMKETEEPQTNPEELQTSLIDDEDSAEKNKEVKEKEEQQTNPIDEKEPEPSTEKLEDYMASRGMQRISMTPSMMGGGSFTVDVPKTEEKDEN